MRKVFVLVVFSLLVRFLSLGLVFIGTRLIVRLGRVKI